MIFDGVFGKYDIYWKVFVYILKKRDVVEFGNLIEIVDDNCWVFFWVEFEKLVELIVNWI